MNVQPLARLTAFTFALMATSALHAETLHLQLMTVPEWKAVYGRVEARNSVPARARIGGTVIDLKVTEGDSVGTGDVIATVKDDKVDFQIAAIDAQLLGLKASLDNAQSELSRGEELIKRGVTTAQRLDALRTQVDVVRNQIAAAEAQRSVYIEQGKEGDVLAPTSGKVLTVPVTRDAVIMAGETVATIGGGGFYLRLAIPERHADLLEEGASIEIDSGNGHESRGRLAKIYPEIDNGRVIADVEVGDLPTSFVNKRVLVRVPVGERHALFLPQAALKNRYGVDYVTIKAGEETTERAVVTAKPIRIHGQPMTEILTGLAAGDEIVLP
ncbi:efflux RND transporter periplasmic adaptor subunit [Rhizobium sp. S95]|uniref:Efflux RND transporter periplasmic adaptor subunit n=1 Tax=Ciceribacter sichuanensis TaxID=2949647 RepID=A0AAJ1F7W5_9HYPH|nr:MULTISPECIES: efflux RND transporter periplasmic adaptor subunit [unclassified Ciceribacter]MCM2396391.1 efflux RND transporter periplasmic adaptor subunit [Ciceribacter sp. S95]MCO5957458.1 efflux RND transporter periplasmic adaptor subunit [Ciceribacter sp. S101]